MSEYSPVALLEARHDRTQFDCGTEALNIYLKQFALQNQKKSIVRNYVTCRGMQPCEKRDEARLTPGSFVRFRVRSAKSANVGIVTRRKPRTR